MILPFKSLSEVAAGILAAPYSNEMTPHEWADFQLHCRAWKQRTGNEVTFKEYDEIRQTFGKEVECG
jgi:hypothetical protein